MSQKRRVAIVGAGIGGLSAAWYLHGRTAPNGDTYVCEVFEQADRIGGNGLTAYFGRPYEKPFADLGVNDFNLTTYVLMHEMLKKVGDEGFPVPYALLSDTDCYFTFPDQPGPQVVFTSEQVAQPHDEITSQVARGNQMLAKLAPDVMTDPKYAEMTVEEFLRAEGFPPDYGRFYFLPRINGMYFMGSVPPAQMPIRGVMNYYILQEGVGGGPPVRCFFERGCSDWFRQLAAALQSRGVAIHLNSPVRVHASADEEPIVEVVRGPKDRYDEVVVAVPADQLRAVVRAGLPDEVRKVEAAFEYYPGTAYAHRFEGVMPARREDWRTYNIHIFPPDSGVHPYTISYVETMHQGRPNAELPCWFVTENPPKEIPEDLIMEMVDPVTGKPTKAEAVFQHNTVTFDSIRAQGELCRLQGGNHLWYTGGWTNGAGLHEQILQTSRYVAARITGALGADEGCPVHLAHDPHHVPEYLRNVLDRGAAYLAALQQTVGAPHD